MTDLKPPVVEREQIIRAVSTIEPMPVATARLLSIVADDQFSISEVVDVVRHDTALVGDVLSLANSAAHAARTPTGDVSVGVARLGAAAVVRIAVARAVKGRLSAALPVYDMAPEDLWRHSLIASVVAEGLIMKSPASVPAGSGTAALIHDVGKTVIASVVPNSFLAALNPAAERDHLDLIAAESLVLGIDHAEVGALVARCWGMPVYTQIALARHHGASDGESAMADAVKLSDLLAHVIEGVLDSEPDEPGSSTIGGKPLSDILTPEVMDAMNNMGLDEADATRLLLESSIASHQMLAQFV